MDLGRRDDEGRQVSADETAGRGFRRKITPEPIPGVEPSNAVVKMVTPLAAILPRVTRNAVAIGAAALVVVGLAALDRARQLGRIP